MGKSSLINLEIKSVSLADKWTATIGLYLFFRHPYYLSLSYP